MFELPTSVFINNKEYPIRKNGDYRMVLDCFAALNDTTLTEEYRIITSLIIFYDGVVNESDIFKMFTKDDLQEAILKMYEFFNCGQENTGASTPHKLIDWTTDAQLIAGAVNTVAKKEVRAEPYLHWWTFMGYYMNIGESAFTTIIGIRHKMKTGKKLEKYERDFKKDNPHYFIWDSKTSEETELDDYVRGLWNNGG